MRAANILCWRHGRSLLELLETIKHLEAVGVDLYIDPQNIGTTTPMGKLLFQITGAFAEFERTMIKTRVRAGMQTVKNTLAVTASSLAGRLALSARNSVARGVEKEKLEAARLELAKGTGIIKTAKLIGLGVGTVHRLKREIGAHAANSCEWP